MSQFEVDADTGELVRIGGRLQRITGPGEIVQGLRVRWRTLAGELLLAPDVGLPLLELAQKSVPVQRVEQLLVAQGLAVPGVTAIDIGETTLDHATRVLSVPFAAQGSLADLDRRVALEGQVVVPIG